jgi:hypothetical protein
MAITTTWIVEIGDRAGWTDFTNRTQGASISQRLRLGAFGTASAVIDMLNNDGELSPDGDGTYAGTDWFSLALRLRVTVTDGTNTETVQAFAGLITGFDLIDDGVNSSVRISAEDLFTIAGRQLFEGDAVQLTEPPDTQIFEMYSADLVLDTVRRPFLGSLNNTPAVIFVEDVSLNYQSTSTTIDYTQGRNVRGVLDNEIMAAGPSIGWPTTIAWVERSTPPDQQGITQSGQLVDRSFVRTETDIDLPSGDQYDDGRTKDKTAARTFVFDSTPTSTELPFMRLERAFNIDDVINAAGVQGQFPTTLTEQIANNTVSQDLYGRRAIQFNSAANPDNGDALAAAELYANRFSVARFNPTRIETTASQVGAVADNAAWQKWSDLLDVESGLFNDATVNYTPTGSSTPVAADLLIIARSIQITTSDTRIVLDLVDRKDYSSFILDSSTLGVLDTNRLG